MEDQDPFDKIIVLDSNPSLDDAMIMRLQYDIAARIHPYEQIAKRYGLDSETELLQYLRQHPQIRKRIKQIRAALESEDSAETRVRLKAILSVEDVLPGIAGIASGIEGQPTTQQRIDAFKQVSRVAGVDGLPANMKGQVGGGNQFTLNIMFRDGTRDLTVTNELSTGTNQLPRSVLPDDSPEYDEEV